MTPWGEYEGRQASSVTRRGLQCSLRVIERANVRSRSTTSPVFGMQLSLATACCRDTSRDANNSYGPLIDHTGGRYRCRALLADSIKWRTNWDSKSQGPTASCGDLTRTEPSSAGMRVSLTSTTVGTLGVVGSPSTSTAGNTPRMTSIRTRTGDKYLRTPA